MLTWIPSDSSTLAACRPSHVLASLMRMRPLSTPFDSYDSMMARAFTMLPSVSNDRRESSSVLTRPGTSLVISAPTLTLSRSSMFSNRGPFLVSLHAMASSTK